MSAPRYFKCSKSRQKQGYWERRKGEAVGIASGTGDQIADEIMFGISAIANILTSSLRQVSTNYSRYDFTKRNDLEEEV